MKREQVVRALQIDQKIAEWTEEKRKFENYLNFVKTSTRAKLLAERDCKVEINGEDEYGFAKPTEYETRTERISFSIAKEIVIPQIIKDIAAIEADIKKLEDEYETL